MKKQHINSFSLLFFLFSLTIISTLSSCRPSPEDDEVVNVAKDDFDIQDQMKIGQMMDSVISMSSDFPRLSESDYPEMYHHLNTLMNQITNTPSVQHREDFEWKISVLEDDDKMTVFATPGGHLFFYTGFLKYLNAEHELVGVIAHELAYMDQGYLIEALKDEFGSKDLSRIISEMNDSEEIAMEMSLHIKDLQFTDDAVMQADSFAMDIVCEFAWDAEGLMQVLERITSENADIEWVMNKPIFEERVNFLKEKTENGNVCGSPDATFESRYFDKIVSKLP